MQFARMRGDRKRDVVAVASEYAQRPAVRRQFLDVEKGDAMLRKDSLNRHKRQVAEVLVVDRVELVFRHQARQMRKLHCDHAPRRKQHFDAADEVVDVGNVRQHVVAEEDICTSMLGSDFGRGLAPEESHDGRNTLVDRAPGHVRRRFDAQHRHTAGDEMLQQVAIVAGDLHHLAGCAEREALDHHFSVASRMFDPARGIGRKVRVLGENLGRCDEFLQLDQKTLFAHIRVQWVKRLHRIQLAGTDV